MSSAGGTDRGPTPTASTSTRVVLVRPWTGGHGGGCCSGETTDPVALDRRAGTPPGHDPEVHRLGECYRLLREELPGVDVQVVSPGNSAYLLPHVYRLVRPATGPLQAARAAMQATRAGAVLVDGRQVAMLPDDDPDRVLTAVRTALDRPPSAG